MGDLDSKRGPIRFGNFEVDFRAGELRKHGTKIKLQEQPCRVLQVLLEQPGQVVTREELQQKIWPADTFVDFDHGLNNAIKRLRETLNDAAETPRYIETTPRRGYRFIGSVTATNGTERTQEEASTGLVAAPAPSRALYRRLVIGGVLFLAFVATLFGFDIGGVRERWLTRAISPAIHSLAVIPLANLSNDPNQEYFSDGMTDALITDLAQIGSVKVISRTSSMQYKQTKKSLPEIARELNVDGIVEGTVQRFGDRVHITAQLIEGTSDRHLWAASYERDTRDVLTLEQEVTDDIAHQIQARLTTQSHALAVQSRPVNLKALEAYLQGNYHLQIASIGIRDSELRKAGRYFQEAVDTEPNFAPAYIGLAEAHHMLFWPSSEDFAIMIGYAEKAVVLDPGSSDARAEVGWAKYEDKDWSGAEEEYRRAIALNPNNAFAHEQLASCLDSLGRLEAGWKEHEIAQALDPNQDHLSHPLYLRGDYDRSIVLLRKRLEALPQDGDAHYFLSLAYEQKGMYRDWVEELGKGLTLMGFPQIAPRLRRALATSGYRGATRQWATELERLAANKQAYFPGLLAQAHTALGDKDRAFYWLREGIDHPRMAISDPVMDDLKTHPGLAPLRSDPRFAELLHRYGLPP